MLLNHLLITINSCPTKHLIKRRAINERTQMHPIIILQIFLFWFTSINIITHTFFKEVKFFTFEFLPWGGWEALRGSYTRYLLNTFLVSYSNVNRKITSLYNNNSLNFIFFLSFSFILWLQLIDIFCFLALFVNLMFTTSQITSLLFSGWCERVFRGAPKVFRTHNNATIYCPQTKPSFVFSFVRIF